MKKLLLIAVLVFCSGCEILKSAKQAHETYEELKDLQEKVETIKKLSDLLNKVTDAN